MVKVINKHITVKVKKQAKEKTDIAIKEKKVKINPIEMTRILMKWLFPDDIIEKYISWEMTTEEVEQHKPSVDIHGNIEKIIDNPIVLTSQEKHSDLEEEKVGESLNRRQELFCQLYTTSKEFYGNGVQSYLEVYNIDRTKKWWYDTACINASKLLSNTKVCNRINNLLSSEWLNDQFVDKQLLHLITQHAEWSNKLWAIREYNKLKQRITDRIKDESESDKAKAEFYKEMQSKVKTMNPEQVKNSIQDLLT